MISRAAGWVRRFSSGPIALATTMLFFLFVLLVLPDQAAAAEEYTRGGPSPDSSFYYSPDDLYAMAAGYGEAGRRAYVRARFTFDLIWPLVYVLFLSSGIGWSFGRLFSPGSRLQWANLLPVAGAGFDLLENLSASLVMVRYPARAPIVDLLASPFTMVKWVLVNSSIVILLLGVLLVLWQRIRGRRDGGSAGRV